MSGDARPGAVGEEADPMGTKKVPTSATTTDSKHGGKHHDKSTTKSDPKTTTTTTENQFSCAAGEQACGDSSKVVNDGQCTMTGDKNCDKNVLNNLYTNCTIAIYPGPDGDYTSKPNGNPNKFVINPFWCFDPTECSHVMQQGYMTGSSDTTENKYCCSKIQEACSLGSAAQWNDYWCSTKPG